MKNCCEIYFPQLMIAADFVFGLVEQEEEFSFLRAIHLIDSAEDYWRLVVLLIRPVMNLVNIYGEVERAWEEEEEEACSDPSSFSC